MGFLIRSPLVRVSAWLLVCALGLLLIWPKVRLPTNAYAERVTVRAKSGGPGSFELSGGGSFGTVMVSRYPHVWLVDLDRPSYAYTPPGGEPIESRGLPDGAEFARRLLTRPPTDAESAELAELANMVMGARRGWPTATATFELVDASPWEGRAYRSRVVMGFVAAFLAGGWVLQRWPASSG